MASKIHMEKTSRVSPSRHERSVVRHNPSIAIFWTIAVAAAEMKTARLWTGRLWMLV
jgi:hypothetical protein